MKLNDNKKFSCNYLQGEEIELRMELFYWLQKKNLSVGAAVELLEITAHEITAASMCENINR